MSNYQTVYNNNNNNVINIGHEHDERDCCCNDEGSIMSKADWGYYGSKDKHKLILDNFSLEHSGVDFMASSRATLFRYSVVCKRKIKKVSCNKNVLPVIIVATVVYLQLRLGLFERWFLETDFRSQFQYPANLHDFPEVVERYIRTNGDANNFQPNPINTAYSKVPFITSPDVSTNGSALGLLIIVKSATRNFSKRTAIRQTWGEPVYLRGNRLATDLPTKVVFISGVPPNHDGSELFSDEKMFDDIVLADFQDCYGNNTFKTLLALRWAVEHVKTFEYLLVVDDDMYINLENAMSFLRDINRDAAQVRVTTSNSSGATANNLVYQSQVNATHNLVSLKNKPLLCGQLCFDAKPFRNKIGMGSKWRMTIDEFEYSYFPPYIAGGATFFDKSTVTRLYYGSLFTEHFWVDDVFIGIIAYKLGITLTGNQYVDSSYEGLVKRREDFPKMIALHGLQCPEQLVKLWHTRNLDSLPSCNLLGLFW